MRPHQKLEVWKQSFELVKNVYKASETLPSAERFGLTSQLRRAVVSIPVNIAEGAARNSNKEFLQFLYIALGSASEVDTLLLIISDLGYLPKDLCKELLLDLENIIKLLFGLINKIKRDIDSKL